MERSRTSRPLKTHTSGPTSLYPIGNTRPLIMDPLSSPMMRSMLSIAALKGKCCLLFTEKSRAQLIEYRAAAGTCNACPVKIHCTPSKRGRHLHRSFFADYQERVKGYHQTLAYQKAMNKRKVWVEPLFAEAKDWHGMRRFRLRRLWRVNCEALVLASGQNLKRLLQKRGWGRRPFPTEAGAKGPPPAWKSDETSRDLLKSRSVSVLVACLTSCDAIRKFFGTHKNLFSLITIVFILYLSIF
jgi:DDE family transposase